MTGEFAEQQRRVMMKPYFAPFNSALTRRGVLAGGAAALIGFRASGQPIYASDWRFGDIRVTKIVDLVLPFDARKAYPDAPLEAFDRNADWLVPNFYDPAKKAIIFSFHSYLVRTPHRTMIVDTCFGNEKLLEGERFNGRWFENLAAAGLKPEDVDDVMNTHFHPDHVGLNTRLKDGKWAPTFPKARYLFNRAEVESVRSRPDGQVYAESVLPVIEAKQVTLIDGDFDVDDGVRIVATPGHTVGHYSIALQSKGQSAILAGDILHNPIEVLYPEWINWFDEDKQASIAQRLKFLDAHTDADITVFAAHFGGPTAGHIVSTKAGRRFAPVSA
jgi:glyoxylase-like metal-dependent hydrolase (beta-lactamase superfamily II)